MHRPLALLAAMLLACCAACSDSDSGDGSVGAADTGLRDALGRVAATDSTRQYVEYGDVALLRRLADGPDGKRFLGVSGYGFGRLAATSKIIADKLRFDPAAMDGAVTAGQPPDTTGLLWGDYDVDAVDTALGDLDIPSEDDDGGKRWTSAKDQEISFDGPLAGIAQTSELNVIRTADGTFAYAPTRAGVDAVTAPGGDTLADDSVLLRLSGCLDEVTAAILVAPTEDDPTAYGVGIRAAEDGNVTEVACLSPKGDAKAVRDHVDKEIKNGTTATSRQPWAEVLPDATVDVVEYGAVVRIAAKPGAGEPVGRVFNMLLTRDLATLAGD